MALNFHWELFLFEFFDNFRAFFCKVLRINFVNLMKWEPSGDPILSSGCCSLLTLNSFCIIIGIKIRQRKSVYSTWIFSCSILSAALLGFVFFLPFQNKKTLTASPLQSGVYRVNGTRKAPKEWVKMIYYWKAWQSKETQSSQRVE